MIIKCSQFFSDSADYPDIRLSGLASVTINLDNRFSPVYIYVCIFKAIPLYIQCYYRQWLIGLS